MESESSRLRPHYAVRADAVIAMRETRSVTTIRHAPIFGQRMVIQKVSSSPLAFSDYLMYPQ
jgi:hypothetical protein